MEHYNLEVNESLDELKSSKDGISNEEAHKRLNEYGYNKLVEGKKTPKIVKFLNEFKDIMIIILIIASIFSYVLAKIKGTSSIPNSFAFFRNNVIFL